jgi:molecular chaperone GrpE
MSDTDTTETPTQTDAGDPAETTASATAETVTLGAAEYEQLKREVVEWKERCVRQQAEFENVRKRLRKEADESGTRATARTVKPVLNEIDNLERAIGAANPAAFSDFAQGVTMIHENLKSALAGMGIERIPCEGVFDPAVHEVLAEQESPDQPRGTIVQVHRSGWKLKDQLVRAAQVVVAKPPAPAAAVSEAPPQAS